MITKDTSCIVTIANPKTHLVAFYDAVAREMGFTNPEDLHYDCRKINVAANIQDAFFEFYRETNPDLSAQDVNMGTAMLLMCSGPKVDENLADNQVEVFEGFIC